MSWRPRRSLIALVFVSVLASIVSSSDSQESSNESTLATPEATKALDALVLIGEPAGPPLSDDALTAETERVAAKLRCPVCQGLSVADSPSSSALAMKEETRELLAVGYSEEQVLDYFERSYGEFVRLLPKPTGLNLVVWIAPLVLLFGGFAFIITRLRKAPAAAKTGETGTETDTKTDSESVITSGPATDGLDDYRERVRKELDR